jgi:hypothetical protein
LRWFGFPLLLEQAHVARAVQGVLAVFNLAVPTHPGTILGIVGKAFPAAHLAHLVAGVRQKEWRRIRPQGGFTAIAQGEREPDGQSPLGPVKGPLPALVGEDIAERRRVGKALRLAMSGARGSLGPTLLPK